MHRCCAAARNELGTDRNGRAGVAIPKITTVFSLGRDLDLQARKRAAIFVL
jgi:hypothetical protein